MLATKRKNTGKKGLYVEQDYRFSWAVAAVDSITLSHIE